MEKEKLEDIDFTREKAKEYIKRGDIIKAEIILRNLWENSSKNDVYLLYDYGEVLRNNGKPDAFIKICREHAKNKRIINNEYIIRCLCWCIYDVYIKDFVKNEESNFQEFIKEATFIKNNSKQFPKDRDYFNPYVLTIFKVVRVYLKSASVNYKEVLRWIEALDPNELSEDVFNFQDDSGQEREMASKKEFYYQYKTKALEKLQRYEECITTCEEALNNIERFHYRNDVWIKSRLYFSKCMEVDEENLESEINKYKELAFEEHHWFMYHKVSSMYWRFGKMDEALLYANKALNCNFKYEMMNRLLQDIALLWENKGNLINAKLYYEASAYYRNREGWKLTEELEFAIKKYNLNLKNKPNINLLQKIASEHIQSIQGIKKHHVGKICNLNETFGFISSDKFKENIYFKTKDVINLKFLAMNKVAEFEVVQTSKGNRAINVKIRRENKNGRNMYK